MNEGRRAGLNLSRDRNQGRYSSEVVWGDYKYIRSDPDKKKKWD